MNSMMQPFFKMHERLKKHNKGLVHLNEGLQDTHNPISIGFKCMCLNWNFLNLMVVILEC